MVCHFIRIMTNSAKCFNYHQHRERLPHSEATSPRSTGNEPTLNPESRNPSFATRPWEADAGIRAHGLVRWERGFSEGGRQARGHVGYSRLAYNYSIHASLSLSRDNLSQLSQMSVLGAAALRGRRARRRGEFTSPNGGVKAPLLFFSQRGIICRSDTPAMIPDSRAIGGSGRGVANSCQAKSFQQNWSNYRKVFIG